MTKEREAEIRALTRRRPQMGDCCGAKVGMLRECLATIDALRAEVSRLAAALDDMPGGDDYMRLRDEEVTATRGIAR